MKVAGVAMLKSRLSELLAAVKAGEEVSVTERGRPIARIVPISPADPEEGRLAELERTGLLKRPTRPLDASFRRLARGRDAAASVRAALAAEREESWWRFRFSLLRP
ncbi:MAG TPA: type II toxin-antitoxin system prevent-host-death family antitoxin [Vicinamibacteria bacterium]|nr:type II toxin-antitoxin system prevent-host-death family antitoxin [Vicinamibacteria bacterium]